MCMTFSEKVLEVRGKLQMTQMQLADELGVSYTTVNRWEKGHHKATFLIQRKFNDFCKKHEITFETENENG